MLALPDPPVQLITGAWTDLDDLRSRVAAALAGGIRWVQLRAKARPASELYAAAMLVAPMLRESGGLFVVNDRVDIALASEADGVHLPEDGMPVADARRLLGEQAWIARSVHSADAIAAMKGDPPCAVQYGPVFETASKRAYGQPKGTRELSAASDAAHSVGIPLVAVGGITAGRVRDCREHGADAVAVIGAIWDSDDVERAARDFIGKAG
ncbi:MAG TPA: thiamine phosphate synthase [Candidatus Limnocylindrales bacterium]|nr:thiamine phosphate synthase [Candidatus Limnocylindrales bacterium]